MAIAETWYSLSCHRRKLGPRYKLLVAAMQQIADWLKKLGMLKYLQRFAENDVDEAVLRHLTDRT